VKRTGEITKVQRPVSRGGNLETIKLSGDGGIDIFPMAGRMVWNINCIMVEIVT
jgi:hypothetical protein